jgi:rifampicin phosphotransferase
VILGNIKNFEPGAGERRFEQGRQEAWAKEQDLLERLHALPDGERKAEEAKRTIDRVRTFIGYREYPKYGIVSRYFVYKQALLEEAERLVQTDVLRDKEDIFYLTFQELHDVVRANQVDDQLLSQRKHAFTCYQALTPPRVLTSEGEVIAGAYRRDDVPTGALVGLPVPPGPSRGGPASSWTWRRPSSNRATSWSRPTRTPAGPPCSSRSRVWSRRWGA